jgi:hypothetical protein
VSFDRKRNETKNKERSWEKFKLKAVYFTTSKDKANMYLRSKYLHTVGEEKNYFQGEGGTIKAV